MKHLTEMVRQHKAGKTNGIYAVCSAHPLVLEAAIRYASGRHGEGVVVRARDSSWSFKVINLAYKG